MKNILVKICLLTLLTAGLSACDGSGTPPRRKDSTSNGSGAGDAKRVPTDAAKSDTSRMDSTEIDTAHKR